LLLAIGLPLINGLADGSLHIDGTQLYPSAYHQALFNA
jgi:hypothetical protein